MSATRYLSPAVHRVEVLDHLGHVVETVTVGNGRLATRAANRLSERCGVPLRLIRITAAKESRP